MLRFLVRAVARVEPSSDADLLARFAAGGDADAFAALVARHGPLVYGAARRLLADPNSADDVFQATFLALGPPGRDVAKSRGVAGVAAPVGRPRRTQGPPWDGGGSPHHRPARKIG